jgi:serine/threonine protein kinase
MQQKTALTHQLLPQTILAKRFLIERVLAEGGFGIIYVGRDLNLEMAVAIKEYYPFGFASRNHTYSEEVVTSSEEAKKTFEAGKEDFLKEARAMARFSTEPGIVNVRDFFKENNTAYIVMDYLKGVTLEKWLEKYKRISVAETLKLMKPLMTALSKIHEEGLIHRDISPTNIMMLEDNQIKLLDFGAVRNVTLVNENGLTIMIKRGYAPEEQYRSKGHQGAWTDVYALCATIYKCITGIKPEDAIQRVHKDELKRPTLLGVSIGRRQEEAIMKGLAVYQEDRFQTVNELKEQLFSEAKMNVEGINNGNKHFKIGGMLPHVTKSTQI